jgi:hypothetical protein
MSHVAHTPFPGPGDRNKPRNVVLKMRVRYDHPARATMMSRHITLDDIQDYIEGRLVPADEGRVEGYLRDNPIEAARVEALRSQAARLRKLGEEILTEPVPRAFLDIVRRLQRE